MAFLALAIVLVAISLIVSTTSDHSKKHGRTLVWSNYAWNVRSGKGNPGPCNWNPHDAILDAQGHLHIKITQTRGKWYCVELDSHTQTGYGTYTFNVLSDLRNLDPSVVLGLFTYDSHGSKVGNSEMDIEMSKWAKQDNPDQLTFSIQPTDADPAQRMKALPLGPPPYSAKFVWTHDHVNFSVTDATGTHTFTGTNLPAPPAKTTQTYINLWLYHGKAPKQPVEIVLGSFNYKSGE